MTQICARGAGGFSLSRRFFASAPPNLYVVYTQFEALSLVILALKIIGQIKRDGGWDVKVEPNIFLSADQ